MRPLCAVRNPGSAVRIEKSGSTPTTTARQSAPKTAIATRMAVGRRISPTAASMSVAAPA